MTKKKSDLYYCIKLDGDESVICGPEPTEELLLTLVLKIYGREGNFWIVKVDHNGIIQCQGLWKAPGNHEDPWSK